MVLNGLRILKSWIEREDHGVNAELQRVPLDAGDPKPRAVRRILDVTRDAGVLRGDYGHVFPVLACAPEEPVVARGEIEQNRRDAEAVSFSIIYVDSDADLAQAVRDGLYTMRALEQSVGRMMRSENVNTHRTRNGIVLQYCVSILYGTVIEEVAEGWMTAAFTATFQARNIMPQPD